MCDCVVLTSVIFCCIYVFILVILSQSTGLSTHSFATKPLELSFHSDEDRGVLARISHADVFQIWDASQLEEEV